MTALQRIQEELERRGVDPVQDPVNPAERIQQELQRRQQQPPAPQQQQAPAQQQAPTEQPPGPASPPRSGVPRSDELPGNRTTGPQGQQLAPKPPAPEGAPPFQPTAKGTMDAVEPGLRAAGSMAGFAAGAKSGAIAGSPLGPLGAGGGAVIGGMLGAALADQGVQLIKDTMHRMGIAGFEQEPPAMQARFKSAYDEMVLDGAFSLAPPVVSATLRGRRQLWGAIMGATPEVRETATRLAKETGVNFGAFQLADGGMSRIASEALGRFPLVGAPLQNRAAKTAAEAVAGTDRLLVQMGPTANLAEAGVDMTKVVDRRFSMFKSAMNKMYGQALNTARANGARMSVEPMLDEAQGILQDVLRKHGKLPDDLVTVQFLRDHVAKPLGVSLKQLSEHGAAVTQIKGAKNVRISLDRSRGLADRWDQAMEAVTKKGQADQAELLMRMKRGLEASANTLDDPQSLAMLQNADATYAKVMTELFETPTAQRFGRIDKRMFKVGHSVQGSRNPDEAVKMAFNLNSPKAINDLKSLVGPKRFNASYAAMVGDNFRSSFETAANSGRGATAAVQNIRNWFGFNDKKGIRYASTLEAFKDSPVRVDQMESMLEALDNVARTAPPDFAAFVARRAVLGGTGSLARAFVPAGSGDTGVLASMIGGIGFVLGAKYVTSVAANPKFVQMTTTALDAGASQQARRAAVVGLYRGLEAQGVLDPQDEIDEGTLRRIQGQKGSWDFSEEPNEQAN